MVQEVVLVVQTGLEEIANMGERIKKYQLFLKIKYIVLYMD